MDLHLTPSHCQRGPVTTDVAQTRRRFLLVAEFLMKS